MPSRSTRARPTKAEAAAASPALWQGRDGHSRLVCADQRDFLRNLPNDSVDCVWTDPPYFLSNDGSTCVAGKRRKVNKGEWDRSQGLQEDHEFNLQWLAECRRVLKPTGTLWVSGTTHIYLSVGMALMQLGFRILNDIVWEKPNPPPNLGCRCFTHSTEMILWASKSAKGSADRYVFNYDDMKQRNEGRQMKNVWRLPAPGADEKRHGRHPTQKPLALIERCIAASTLPGQIVLDPFTGSGSTGVASLKLGRQFIGCELTAEYAQLAAARLGEIDSAS